MKLSSERGVFSKESLLTGHGTLQKCIKIMELEPVDENNDSDPAKRKLVRRSHQASLRALLTTLQKCCEIATSEKRHCDATKKVALKRKEEKEDKAQQERNELRRTRGIERNVERREKLLYEQEESKTGNERMRDMEKRVLAINERNMDMWRLHDEIELRDAARLSGVQVLMSETLLQGCQGLQSKS